MKQNLSSASSWSHCRALQALETPLKIWIQPVKSPGKDPPRYSDLSSLYNFISQLMKNICNFFLFPSLLVRVDYLFQL